MATTVYDSLSGDNTQQVTLAAGSTLGYPSSNLYNVFGPVYLPKIYGKDLSAFEIASSGKVSITLHDTYAFDLDRNVADQTSFLQTIPGDSFVLKDGNSKVAVKLDANLHNLELTANSNLIITAKEIVYNVSGDSSSVSGGNAVMDSAGSILVRAVDNVDIASTAKSVNLTSADSNVYVLLDSTTCNLNEYARSNVNIAASNTFHLEARVDTSIASVTGSLFMNAANSNVAFTLDGTTFSAALVAKSNIDATAAASMSLVASSNVRIAGSNELFLYGDKQVQLTANDAAKLTTTSAGFATMFANVGVNMQANDHMSLNADGQLAMHASDSNTFMTLNSTGALLYALTDIKASASNVLEMTAKNDVTLTSVIGNLYVYDSSNVSMAMSNNSLALTARSNVQITASNLIDMFAGSNIVMGAHSNIDVTAVNGSVHMSAADARTTLYMDAPTCDISVYAASNFLTTSSNNTDIIADKAMHLTSLNDIIAMNASKDLTMTTAASTIITATKDYTVQATTGVIALSAPSSNMTLTAGTFALTSASNIIQATNGLYHVGATSTIQMTSSNDSITFSADADRVTLKLDKVTDNLIGYALSNINLTSGQDFNVDVGKNTDIKSVKALAIRANGGATSLTLGDDSTVKAVGVAYTFDASAVVDSYKFNIGANNMVTVQSDKMIVNGGLDVYGTVNSISVQNTELHINDKTIQLAYPVGGEVIADGAISNSASGMVINGMPPTSLPTELAAKVFKKSFDWNYGADGIDGMRTSIGIATESYWNLQGGRFQLSSHKDDGKQIAFALRINEMDELEMVKIWDDADNVTQIRRIAKFGKTLM